MSVIPSMRDLTSQMIIGNANVPFILLMNPNPQNFRVQSRKSFSEAQTLGSWVYEHWGNRPDTIQCVGWTTRKVGGPEDFAKVDFQILRLQQIFKLDKERMVSFLKTLNKSNIPTGANVANLNSGQKAVQNQITGQRVKSLKELSQSFIVYRFTLYLGFFTSFSYSEQIERPRLYDYAFEFVVNFSSTDYIARQLLVNFPDNLKIGLGSTIQGITNAPGFLTGG